MAKKLVKLTFRDIVLQADAETIREAYEARLSIDGLLVKREEAYRQIETIELEIEQLVGEEGAFVYPAPPVPVAGFSKPVPSSRPVPPKPKVVEEVKEDKVVEQEPAPSASEESTSDDEEAVDAPETEEVADKQNSKMDTDEA